MAGGAGWVTGSPAGAVGLWGKQGVPVRLRLGARGGAACSCWAGTCLQISPVVMRRRVRRSTSTAADLKMPPAAGAGRAMVVAYGGPGMAGASCRWWWVGGRGKRKGSRVMQSESELRARAWAPGSCRRGGSRRRELPLDLTCS